jgi:hypothetical protein
MANLPAQTSKRVTAFLEKVRTASRARLIFALDATASRQPTWDLACQLQSDMFDEVAKIGGLEIQLVYYRGVECKSSAWMLDAVESARAMRKIECEGGKTQIGKVFAHVRTEHAREKVAAVIFVGDAVEELPSELYATAAGLGTPPPPLFMFQEGDVLAMPLDQHGMPLASIDAPPQKVEQVFREIARLTNGAYARFNAGAARELAELLRAVAAFATGGLTALADLRSDSARKLLGQMKK